MRESSLKIFIFFIFFLVAWFNVLYFSLSEGEIERIFIGRFAPGLKLSVLQGSWVRLYFWIENRYNESLIIFYRFEKPSGIEIEHYPPKYYSLDPNTEIAGNLNISVDPYLENRSYTIKFWVDTFVKTENGTIRSNKVTLNLTVLSNPSLFNATTTTTTVITETTVGEVPIETLTTVSTIEAPIIIPPIEENHEKISYREYLMILGVIVFLLIIPLLMLRKFLTKEKVSTSFQERIQA
ncbi:MAG: hypothetical protein QMD36_05555 [Candidatus Aenigmarchaeota archaeon]|nr:hypothetical protein [Candidatus Aenigmarchaeota archaeon]